MTIRNYEKLFHLSEEDGVETLSFNSCYHIFDHECIMKTLNIDNLKSRFKCPVCRIIGNIIVPFHKKYAEDARDRIATTAYTMHEFNHTFNIYE